MSTKDYRKYSSICCPHCGVTVQLLGPNIIFINNNGHPVDSNAALPATTEADNVPYFDFSVCPGCNKGIVQARSKIDDSSFLVEPRTGFRGPVHPSVPDEIRSDYEEAVLVLDPSPKASAALSRRCLQTLLEDQDAPKGKHLKTQLDEIVPNLPSYIQPFVNNIRELGNISAHPSVSRSTGEIVDVEKGEAEWMLEVLEQLFDHFYAKPADAKKKQAAMDKKFKDAKPARVG